MEKDERDREICEAAFMIGAALGTLSKHRRAEPARCSDLYQQALGCIPPEEIEKHLAAWAARIVGETDTRQS